MPYRLFVLIVLSCGALSACQAASHPQLASAATISASFGPVISTQVIRGREEDAGGDVLLLVDTTIVRVDLARRHISKTTIGVEAGEACWGLARLADGSLWTLKGRNAVVRIEPDGRVSKVIPLGEAHAGLTASGNRLVLQRAIAAAGEPALYAAAPDAPDRRPWSDLEVRSFPNIARAQVSVLSLVACGRSLVPARPCWFPDEAALALIEPDGRTLRVSLNGIAPVTPELLLTAENPKRPVRDAYVDARRRIWVLSTGEPPSDGDDRPGGWLLARYTADGTLDGMVSLSEPVRLILRVDAARVTVLAGSGRVGEIASW
jgi:hypothetical protein